MSDEQQLKKEDPVHRLWWIDLEMTGLDVRKEVIIEVALVITDTRLQNLDQYHSVVRQDPVYLENMDEWNTKHHAMSGLVKQVPQGRELYKVEDDLMALWNEHSRNDKVVLAGNSIAHDRLFIRKYFTRFAQHLHHRMLDVSALKIVFRDLLKHEYEKPASHHRALEDVQASINELKEYLKYIRVPSV